MITIRHEVRRNSARRRDIRLRLQDEQSKHPQPDRKRRGVGRHRTKKAQRTNNHKTQRTEPRSTDNNQRHGHILRPSGIRVGRARGRALEPARVGRARLGVARARVCLGDMCLGSLDAHLGVRRARLGVGRARGVRRRARRALRGERRARLARAAVGAACAVERFGRVRLGKPRARRPPPPASALLDHRATIAR